MSEHYPRIRIEARNGTVVAREALSMTFYMRPPHQAIVQDVMRALDAYLRSIGPKALGLYADEEGDWRELNEQGWELVRRQLLEDEGPRITLEAPDVSGRSAFLYRGKDPEAIARMNKPDAMCEATFWLSTEFLEEHGPARVRELAIELASLLPLCSGSCGLAFVGGLDLVGVSTALAHHWMRYPGIDIPGESGYSWEVGTRIRGPHWVNFLGQPVLRELGGVEGLRTRLRHPGTSVQEVAEDKVAITLGEWPEAGDVERGDVLPAYRELARVLEPWLHRTDVPVLRRPMEETRRWERRFLD
ncbi:type VI immunity family protein [Hyalangium gracile]|uniref:type VI immunity family protein n=1 Tax=Hyalangium gracile TaxID=394092 RepID=UPI001CCB3303|nr:type VI immunity family protein [Hyalangium gracile]